MPMPTEHDSDVDSFVHCKIGMDGGSAANGGEGGCAMVSDCCKGVSNVHST